MTLFRDLHNALAHKDADRIAEIGRRILEADPPYPTSLLSYVAALLSAGHNASFSSRGAPRYDHQRSPHRCLTVASVEAGYDSSAPTAAPSEPRVRDDVACIAASGLFDSSWYRAKYLADTPDVSDEILHYCEVGWRTGCNPNSHFSVSYYLTSNPDVRHAGSNPLLHYVRQGRKEGRTCLPPVLDTPELQVESDEQYVFLQNPRIDFIPRCHSAVAFYRPQFLFHSESDGRRGEVCTARPDIRHATSILPDHHGPGAPGELGHHDSEASKVIKRHIRIAKNYLLDAFCFKFFWLDGKIRLETPAQLFHADPSIDFQYCLLWANEAWGRRGTGLGQDTVTEERHSPADDLAVLDHIAPYLKDLRYLRVSGRPLLIVDQPTSLPDPRATAERWRTRCRELGVGEIHLAVTDPVEIIDPRTCGFDSALELGQNQMQSWLEPSAAEGLPAAARGPLFAWQGLDPEGIPYPQTDYDLYRCVKLNWGNTARKNLNDVIQRSSSPRAFQQWTVNAIDDATKHFGSNGLVFIDAWSGLAQDARLEPRQAHGYAYLEAFRQARVRTGARSRIEDSSRHLLDPSKVAIIVHSYYPEVLPEIFEMLARIGHIDQPSMIITTPHSKIEDCAEAARAYRSDIRPLIIGVENRGRDILPFFTAFEYIARAGCRVFCKLHTKRSLHREDGTEWRRRLFGSLLDPDKIPQILDSLSRNTSIGVVAPDDHLLPMSTHWVSNKHAVLSLAARLGVEALDVLACPLVAGSMFWARTEALFPLYALVDSADFESESGQTDGTMAHAIERLVSVSAHSIGLHCIDVSGQPFDYTADVEFALAARG